MAGSLGDLGGLLQQAQKMQRQVAELQEELKKRTFEGSAGGGAVKVTVTGAKEIVSVTIAPEAVDPDDVSLLEDMVRGAISEALNEADATAASEMERVTGGMGLPGLPGMG